MAETLFFDSAADIRMAQDFVAQDNDLYISKVHWRGRGVYANSTAGVSTLTPAVSPAWSVDAYNSLINDNLVIYDDNGKACRGKVADTSATAITFDETAMDLEEDETTAPTFTAGLTYDFYILTPSKTVYGNFFGQTKNAELNITDESNKFNSGAPAGLLHKNLQSRMMELTIAYLHRSNADFLKLFGLETYGAQTSQFSYGLGVSDPVEPGPNLYELVFLGYDRQNRAFRVHLWFAKFDMSGNLFNKGDSGDLEHPLHADLLINKFYPAKALYGKIVRVA